METETPPAHPPFIEIEILSLHVRLGLIMCYVLIAIFGICGNALALVVVVRSSKTSVPTKMCLVSLAISDLLLTTITSATNLDQIMDCFHSWDFGQAFCTIFPFVQFVLMMANGTSLVVMAIQRYLSLHFLITSKGRNWAESAPALVAGSILALIWIIPLCCSLPFLDSFQLSVYNCSWFPDFFGVEYSTVAPKGYKSGSPSPHSENIEEDFVSIILCREISPDDFVNDEADLTYCHMREGKKYVASRIGICDADGPESAETVYHIGMGVVYGLIIITLFKGFYFLRAAKKCELQFKRQLPPTSLRNIELMQDIRTVLRNRRRGVRIIMFMLVIFVVCRFPFWIFILSGKTEFYFSRSRSMLGLYFLLHWLGNLKAAVTAYVYAHSSNAFQSNDHKHHTVYRKAHSCSWPWKRHKISGFSVNENI